MGSAQSKAEEDAVRETLSKNKNPLNILILGHTGAGKSTFINSMQMALGHKWCDIARSGKGVGQNIPLFLKKYEMFLDEYNETPVEGYKHKVCFWDCSGFTDHGDEVYVNFIGRVLEGFVPDETNVLDASNQLRDDAERVLSQFSERDPSRKFHRIVLLLEADKPLPRNLMEAVRQAAEVRDRAIPLFLLITKLDKIGTNNQAYEERKQEALQALNLVGENQKFCETYLYCNAKCRRNHLQQFNPVAEIDKRLMAFCFNLTNSSYEQGTVYENP
ncbi:uncharacterized protein LOC144925273 [Branchiostoma floridae x Branchiostoma belcheri]